LLQDFPKDRTVDLPNLPIRKIIITVYKKNPSDPMAITLRVVGCFKPGKFITTMYLKFNRAFGIFYNPV